MLKLRPGVSVRQTRLDRYFLVLSRDFQWLSMPLIAQRARAIIVLCPVREVVPPGRQPTYFKCAFSIALRMPAFGAISGRDWYRALPKEAYG